VNVFFHAARVHWHRHDVIDAALVIDVSQFYKTETAGGDSNLIGKTFNLEVACCGVKGQLIALSTNGFYRTAFAFSR
jgi:hypothetical protein